jgi:hypothetical protein
VWFGIVGRVLQKSLAFLCEREYTWSCNLMRIAIWGLICGAEKSSQRFRIILQPAVRSVNSTLLKRISLVEYLRNNLNIYLECNPSGTGAGGT